MPKRTLTLALASSTAIIAGIALGFFELTIAGILAAAVTAALWFRTRSA